MLVMLFFIMIIVFCNTAPSAALVCLTAVIFSQAVLVQKDFDEKTCSSGSCFIKKEVISLFTALPDVLEKQVAAHRESRQISTNITRDNIDF